jgi:hypothetical protein
MGVGPAGGANRGHSVHDTIGGSIATAEQPSEAWLGRPTMGRATRPPNKELKLTKPCTIGASQLNSSVRPLFAGSRLTGTGWSGSLFA